MAVSPHVISAVGRLRSKLKTMKNYGITIFALIALISFVVSCGSCVGWLSRVGDPKNAYGYLDDSTDLWLGRFAIGFIVGLLVAFLSFFIAILFSVSDEPPSRK